MPTKSSCKRVQELERETDELEDGLDQVFDIVAPKDGGEDDDKGSDLAKASLICDAKRRAMLFLWGV
jgi:hypothetical protein